MGFVQSIKSCMAKSIDFSGRASRSEFWWFILFLSILHTVLANLFSQSEMAFSLHFGIIFQFGLDAPWWANLYTAIFGLPLISVFVRRAHDIGVGEDKICAALFICLAAYTILLKLSPTPNTQQWLLIIVALVFIAGFLLIATKRSDLLNNRFGPNPHSNPTEVPS
ncbi:DUF805 domain-containing protein [Octadecabacter sp. G9-8]|uniref:DUF805 domain-containing protein n=1 Tax=Octadecabacter dasysiphoniae TaxID=2909341 RepID=A0ABS9CTP4_9RHOB|nr:DUF805 domain-containing protein [Octadecabacter dasysiphoniae]MCF2869581.1 DUF805 domain-containing protein [Octadecabacter dasysiphoniae]